MSSIESRRYNDCPRCPIVGQENTSENDFFQILALRFNLHVARQLCLNRVAIPVESMGLERWLQRMPIDWEHVDHLPADLDPGIMVTLPSGSGMPLIDGNHRAARALRDRKEFFAFVLPETETLELLRRSLGAHVADDSWRRMTNSKPHPKDVSLRRTAMSSFKTTQLHREFYYNGIRIPDPGPGLSVDQVRDLITPNYPEIATASVSGPEDTGSMLRYTFSRAIGSKG